MRTLVYGAGNIGSLYAARLADSSADVSILARGNRAKQIQASGIQLEDGLSGQRTTTSLQVVERLDPNDSYDLVLVALPKHRIAEVLPALVANQRTPSVMFFCNNAAGPAELVDALGHDRVLLGFPGAAGFPRGRVIRYVITSKREQPTTIGELDGSESPRIVAIAAELRSAGFPVAICPNMDAWLKTHAAEILPTLCALNRVGGAPGELARSPDALRLMLRAIREGYQVLRAAGVPITPGNHRLFEWMPEALLLLAMKRQLGNRTAAIKAGHADKSLAEFQLLTEEFQALMRHANVPTQSLDALFPYLRPTSSMNSSRVTPSSASLLSRESRPTDGGRCGLQTWPDCCSRMMQGREGRGALAD